MVREGIGIVRNHVPHAQNQKSRQSILWKQGLNRSPKANPELLKERETVLPPVAGTHPGQARAVFILVQRMLREFVEWPVRPCFHAHTPLMWSPHLAKDMPLLMKPYGTTG